MGTSPAGPAMFCNACGAANAPSNPSCIQCGRPFPDVQHQLNATLASPSGFGGWLLLFCFGACFASPVWFAKIYLHPPFMLHWVMFASAVPVLLGIVAGVLLGTERAQAIVVLRLFLLSLAAKSAIWFATAVVEPGDKTTQLTVAIQTLLYTVVWALYFQRSVRVRNTYGKNL